MVCPSSVPASLVSHALLQQAFVHSAMQSERGHRDDSTAVGFQSAVPRNCNALSGFVSLSQRTPAVGWDSSVGGSSGRGSAFDELSSFTTTVLEAGWCLNGNRMRLTALAAVLTLSPIPARVKYKSRWEQSLELRTAVDTASGCC